MQVVSTEDIIKYLGEIEEEHEIRPYHEGSEMFTIQCLKCEEYILIELERRAIVNIVQHCGCEFSKNFNSVVLRQFRNKIINGNKNVD